MNSAFIVLDVQKDFTEIDGRFPAASHQVCSMIENINNIITHFNEKMEIIYVGNEFERTQFISNWFRNHGALKGSVGAQLDPELKIVNDMYFSKKQGDAFSNESLYRYINEHQIEHIVIAGLYAEGCVFATAKGALRRGLRVSVVEDAVSGATDEKRNKSLRKLESLGIKVMQTREVLND